MRPDVIPARSKQQRNHLSNPKGINEQVVPNVVRVQTCQKATVQDATQKDENKSTELIGTLTAKPKPRPCSNEKQGPSGKFSVHRAGARRILNDISIQYTSLLVGLLNA